MSAQTWKRRLLGSRADTQTKVGCVVEMTGDVALVHTGTGAWGRDLVFYYYSLIRKDHSYTCKKQKKISVPI